MPELITHSLVGYVVAKSFRKSRFVVIVLIGAVLPDVLTRVPYMVLGYVGDSFASYNDFFHSLHSPFPLLLVCLIISYLFAEEIRVKVFFGLLVGAGTHLFLDMMQRTIIGLGYQKLPIAEYSWLFPFSWHSFQIGLFWPEDSLYAVPVLVPCVLLIFFLSADMKKEAKQG